MIRNSREDSSYEGTNPPDESRFVEDLQERERSIQAKESRAGADDAAEGIRSLRARPEHREGRRSVHEEATAQREAGERFLLLTLKSQNENREEDT
ncbi:hypothetical protein [Rubrobacter radiotolerans]|uniref:Uncharacterized protein n=1 Tax=Rubrobacter radiotolerans TaxID=42256 RepID=A0AB35TD83_RUBRA|nr:hypothetical protein [Rubrobacter radiotolerans]MDX5895185.1 hypothetical protein [Rubrobacter radiotolerans]